MPDVNSIIEKLDYLKKTKLVNVVLSDLTLVDFKPVTMTQQKSLLKHAIDGPLGAISILKELNEIILANNTTSQPLKVIDKYLILLQLRKHSLGNMVNVNGKSYDLTELPNHDIFKTTKLTETIAHEGFIINLGIPSLQADTEYLTKILNAISKMGSDNAKESITLMYLYEIAKFITSIEIAGDVLLFDTISLNDRINIVEQLPLSINTKILSYINSVRDIENKLITFSDKTIVPINTLFLSND